MKLLIVESPAKAKTIKGYLDKDFEVVSTVGHIRDLPKKEIGIDENNFSVKKWEITSTNLNPVLNNIKKSNEVFLALDPDREGEMIAWHLIEVCREENLLEGKNFKRIEFTAVRKNDILEALKNPRDINEGLVNAAKTRKFLDKFFGYKISPITRRRTSTFGKSAGRVQSPTLKILAEREKEIDIFVPEEYWEFLLELKDKKGNKFNCDLLMDGEKKIEKLSIKNQETAEKIKRRLEIDSFFVENINKREVKRNPYSPFSNSLLLQDASSKLGFSPSNTNRIAQELKDGIGSFGGLITYHRSDSNQMKKSETEKLRQLISSKIGKEYLSTTENIYKEKAKFVQQGHEAVTPTNLSLNPDDVKYSLRADQHKLYELIWRRTIASQMSPTLSLETSIYIKSQNFLLKTRGSIPKFAGFKKIYNYSDSKNESQELPSLEKNDSLEICKIEPKKNYTKPPNRYTEASVIRKLEELGIGRPSTYHSIFSKLKTNGYINIEKRTVRPTASGKIISKFLDCYFKSFVDYNFTADLERQLDQITESKLNWKDTLKTFLEILSKSVLFLKNISTTDVIKRINENSEELIDKKKCPKCNDGELYIQFAPAGPFVGCSNFNKKAEADSCKYKYSLDSDENNQELSGLGKKIGTDPTSKNEIFLKSGRYGRYLELKIDEEKPKRISIPNNMQNETINIERALKLLSLPKTIGKHPEFKIEIIAKTGAFGPYISCGPVNISVSKNEDIQEIGMNRAVELINKKMSLIGTCPKSNENVFFIQSSRRTPSSIGFKGKKISLPKDTLKEEISLDGALEIINEEKKKKKKFK